MKTGIVVLNYNDAIETIDFVEKISTFNAVDIICVVDNCSTDDSVKQLKKLKNIELIALDTNEGYAGIVRPTQSPKRRTGANDDRRQADRQADDR